MLVRLKVQASNGPFIELEECRELFPWLAEDKLKNMTCYKRTLHRSSQTTFNLLTEQQQKEEIGNLWNGLNTELSNYGFLAEFGREITHLKVSLYVCDDLREVSEEKHYRMVYSLLKSTFPYVTRLQLFLDDTAGCVDPREHKLPDNKLPLLMDHFPMLGQLSIISHYALPSTFERIRSTLKNLRTLQIGQSLDRQQSLNRHGLMNGDCKPSPLTRNACEVLAVCILDMPSLSELVIPNWTAIGVDPKEILEPLLLAVGSSRNLQLDMARRGDWRFSSNSFNIHSFEIPDDQWVVLMKMGPIVNHIKQHYGIIEDDDGGPLEPWVEALIAVRPYVHLDCIYTMVQQMPKVWSNGSTTLIQQMPELSSHGSTTMVQQMPELSSHGSTTTVQQIPELLSHRSTTTVQQIPELLSHRSTTTVQQIPELSSHGTTASCKEISVFDKEFHKGMQQFEFEFLLTTIHLTLLLFCVLLDLWSYLLSRS